jgi:NitT/TauT family transport system substrate-binding protein
MKKPIVLLVLVAAVLAALGLFLISVKESAKPAMAEARSLRLAWVYDMAEAGVFVAEDKGLFDKAGIKLTTEPGGFGLDPIRLVAAGTNDFGIAGAGNLLLARSQGVPVVAIGAEFHDTPVGFVVKRDSGLKTFTDFRGKRIGIQTGADTDVLYRALLKINGMTSADVIEVPIQFDVTPFVAGQIDVLPGYVTNQPVTLSNQSIAVDVISARSQGLSYYGNVYFTSETMIRDHPDTVRRFLVAVRGGWEEAFSDKTSAVAAVKKRAPDFADADLSTIYDAVMPFVKPESTGANFLTMSDEKWRTTEDVLLQAGLLATGLDIKKAYTNAFVE